MTRLSDENQRLVDEFGCDITGGYLARGFTVEMGPTEIGRLLDAARNEGMRTASTTVRAPEGDNLSGGDGG